MLASLERHGGGLGVKQASVVAGKCEGEGEGEGEGARVGYTRKGGSMGQTAFIQDIHRYAVRI
jgi:hypothetical protein